MAYEQLASDLAATFYAASLISNPTLKRGPKAAAVEAYEAKGRELAKKVLNPDRPALIRCTCGTRLNRPDRPSRAIAAVSDRSLLIVRGPRGPVYDGLRLQEHYLVDLGIARRDGHKSASVWCYGCGALHELSFRWLKRARRNEISTPIKQYQLAPWGAPIEPQGYTPTHANDPKPLAFAITTGPLDAPEVPVTLGWRFAFEYRNRFGFRPPHGRHLLRLSQYGNPRLQDPHIQLLPPKWWRILSDLLRRNERLAALVTKEAP